VLNLKDERSTNRLSQRRRERKEKGGLERYWQKKKTQEKKFKNEWQILFRETRVLKEVHLLTKEERKRRGRTSEKKREPSKPIGRRFVHSHQGGEIARKQNRMLGAQNQEIKSPKREERSGPVHKSAGGMRVRGKEERKAVKV